MGIRSSVCEWVIAMVFLFSSFFLRVTTSLPNRLSIQYHLLSSKLGEEVEEVDVGSGHRALVDVIRADPS